MVNQIYLLFVVYAGYLIFQLWSHANLYDDKHSDKFQSQLYGSDVIGPRMQMRRLRKRAHLHLRSKEHSSSVTEVTNGELPDPASVEAGEVRSQDIAEEEEEVEKPSMSVPMTIGLLITVAVVSFIMKGSINLTFLTMRYVALFASLLQSQRSG